MNNMLNIENLSAWYNKSANVLQDVSFSINQREIVGLIGVNGAGKTTLINVLSGMHTKFTAKKTEFQMENISFSDNAFKVKRYTVFAEDESFRYFNFIEYAQHVFASYGKPFDEKIINRLVEGFCFNQHCNKSIKDLSFGNRKKVFLITAFALCPDILFLDEPMNGLDFQSVEYLYREMKRYREVGSILFSSHILESFSATADQVLVLEDCRINRRFMREELEQSSLRGILNERYFSFDEEDIIGEGK